MLKVCGVESLCNDEESRRYHGCMWAGRELAVDFFLDWVWGA